MRFLHGAFPLLCLQSSLSGFLFASATTVSSLSVKKVDQYPLPAAAQTHEILAVSDNLLLVTQQSDGGLLKVSLDSNGQPMSVRKWTPTNPWSGLHGLALQGSSRGSNSSIVWATVQFDNAVLKLNPNGNDIHAAPQVLQTIPLPAPASGPHGILEHNGNLWIACKDSSHVVRVSSDNPDDHQVWAVSGRPIFVAVHPTSGHVYASLDSSSKIWHYKNDGSVGEEISIPPEKGSTPVGLVAGPDKNVWVTLLGNKTAGTGTFGRINPDASIDWMTLSSAVGSTAPLIHVAFDQDPSRFWLLGSSTVCPTCVNAVFTVKIEDGKGTAKPRIAIQNTIMLPTQNSWTHRMISHRKSLFVSELTTSTLTRVGGAAVQGLNVSETWDKYAGLGQGLKADIVIYDDAF